MVIKCKMCGGNLVLEENSTIAECEYCGSLQTVPSADNEKKITLFSRANRLRLNCEFDKAGGVYESIVVDFPKEPEAYWGLVLCKYGIEYVDDPASGKKVPTCHRSSFSSVMEDADFARVLENADPVARKIYQEEAEQIEEIRKGILEVSSKEAPYDVFICYKETGEQGERTLDSVLAQDIYDALTEKKYRVFFARITLEDKLGQEYEPYIFAALNSAKVMLVVGTNYEHFDAVWVKNEWSRYLKLVSADSQKHLIPCYRGIDAYDMPKEFSKLQAQDLGKVGAIQDLLRGVDKLIAPSAPTIAAPKGAETAPLLSLGNEALEAGEWSIASSRFDLALTVDPMCADAYVGKLLAENKCKKREQLGRAKKRLNKSAQYKQAVAYADDALKQELSGYCKKTETRYWRKVALLIMLGVAAFAAVFIAIEMNFRSIINQYHKGTLTTASAYEKLSAWSWYRQPDKYTQYIIEKEEPGTYPLATKQQEITVPDSVTHIRKKSFYGNTKLTKIILPDSINTIGENAFQGCIGLTELTLPDGVTTIKNRAFEGCTGLTKLTLPDSVTTIEDRAFQGCTRLMELALPSSVTSIGKYAFGGCIGLTELTLSQGITSIGAYAFNGCSGLTELILPQGITSIGAYAFDGCTALTKLTLPDSVTAIENRAFQGCTGLTELVIPNGVTAIEENTFNGCTGLKKLILPDGVKKINKLAFYNCENLKTVTIPKSVTFIGHGAFSNCEIQNIRYAGSKADWEKINILEGNDFSSVEWQYNSK